jgi:DNA topoisomerase-1
MGVDARGRRQYIYHADWRAVRDETKFETLVEFARQLPKIRRTVGRHLRERGLTRNKILAAVVRLLETTLIRVGNDEYANHNGSYGLTTMHSRHARVRGDKVVFEFRGKSGILHQIQLADSELATIVRRCQQLPGQQLFQYRDKAGEIRDVTSTDVNQYLQEITGKAFTAKDFRTWAGTVLAAEQLCQREVATSQAGQRKTVNAALREVAQCLGNTLAVCRKSYIHPRIVECFCRSALPSSLGPANKREAVVLALLTKDSGQRTRDKGLKSIARHTTRTRRVKKKR